MKNTILLITFLSLINFAHAQNKPANPQMGDKTGNGGAGVYKDGQYKTFYGAGLYVEPSNSFGGGVTDHSQSIPTINMLMDNIKKMKFLTEETKAKYLRVILPTPNRQYFRASPDSLTPVVLKRLLAEFTRVTGIDAKNLKLYALTDTNSKTTFLLPEFFTLNEKSQQAIIFHENHWIVNPNTNYHDVVKTEMAFQAVLESPTAARIYELTLRLGNPYEIEHAAVNWDFETQAMKGFLDSSNSFSIKQLIGAAAVQCLEETKARTPGADRKTILIVRECAPYIQQNMQVLAQAYPNSVVLNRIIQDMYSSYNFYTNTEPDRIDWGLQRHSAYYRYLIGFRWLTITIDPRRPLNSRAILGEYNPG